MGQGQGRGGDSLKDYQFASAPCVREAAAFASRGGLTRGLVLGDLWTHHCVLEGKPLLANFHMTDFILTVF